MLLKIDADLVFKHFLVPTGTRRSEMEFVWLLAVGGYEYFTETDKRFNFPISQNFKTIETHFIYSNCTRQWPTIRYCFMPFSTYYTCMKWTDNTENYSHSMNKTFPIDYNWMAMRTNERMSVSNIDPYSEHQWTNWSNWANRNVDHISVEIYCQLIPSKSNTIRKWAWDNDIFEICSTWIAWTWHSYLWAIAFWWQINVFTCQLVLKLGHLLVCILAFFLHHLTSKW